MRCLSCRQNGLPKEIEKCPNCGESMLSLLHGMLLSGDLLHNDRYRIDYPLGRGGFGITYRAFDTRFDNVVVIKEFFPQEQVVRHSDNRNVIPFAQKGSYKKAMAYFLGEARILARIKKENVVRVFDSFESHNTAYIVMELVAGHTLRELQEERPKHCFPPDEVEKIAEQLVDALEAIHFNGVFHLDISPDNVMQTDAGKIVLIDFGAARRSLRTNDTGGPHQFKPAYAPLELMAGTSVGPESDLFELATMVYELLIGNLPPPPAQRAATDDKWKPQLPDERWEKALTRALYLKREKRPASVREWWNLYRRTAIVFGDRKVRP